MHGEVAAYLGQDRKAKLFSWYAARGPCPEFFLTAHVFSECIKVSLDGERDICVTKAKGNPFPAYF